MSKRVLKMLKEEDGDWKSERWLTPTTENNEKVNKREEYEVIINEFDKPNRFTDSV